jgi:hypothetical protein
VHRGFGHRKFFHRGFGHRHFHPGFYAYGGCPWGYRWSWRWGCVPFYGYGAPVVTFGFAVGGW